MSAGWLDKKEIEGKRKKDLNRKKQWLMYYYSHLVARSFKIFIRLLRSPFTWLVRVVVHAFQVSCSPMFLYKHKCYFSFFFFYGVNNEKMHTPNQCFFLPNLLFRSNIPLTFPYRLLLVWILPAASERPPCSLFFNSAMTRAAFVVCLSM